MAELYLARSSDACGVQQMVVLKVIANRYARDDAFAKMFQDEVRIAATLCHPSIGQVVDVGEAGGRQYLAMEHLHGKDVRAIVRQLRSQGRRGIPPQIAVHIGTRICAGLHHAHEARDIDGQPLNTIHRDVSPSNIMVTYEGQVKLLDFGIAKAANRVSLTQPGTIKGKVRYLSPEQLLGNPIDRRTDIFTLGVSLWESTVGCHLFEGKQDFQVYDAISKGAVRPPSKLLPGYPPELERVVLKALAFEPDDRYATARELQSDLERYAMRDQLMLSDLATADFLQQLFADEFGLWIEAQAAGQSLLDYLMATASEEDQELGSMRTGEEPRDAKLPSTSAAGAIEPRLTASDLPPSVSGGASERKTIVFGQGPMAAPIAAGTAPASASASVGGPMTVSARRARVTGPSLPLSGEREKRGTDPRSLPAQQPALRVRDGAAVELRPEQVEGGGNLASGGYAMELGVGSSSEPDHESKRPTMITDESAPVATPAAPCVEPADSSKHTIVDLEGGPLAGSSPAAAPRFDPLMARRAPTSTTASSAPPPDSAQPPRSSLVRPQPSQRRGAQLAFGLATAPSSPGRKLTMIDSGAAPIGGMAKPLATPSTPTPAVVPPTRSPTSQSPTPQAPAPPGDAVSEGGRPALVPSHDSQAPMAYESPEMTTASPPLPDEVHPEPVIAEDRASLSAQQQMVVEKATRMGRPQTGDWSHQGRDRRPGTHPFFKGRVVEAAGVDNPYTRGDETVPGSKAPVIILIALVLLLGGGAVAVFSLLRGGDEAKTFKLTSRPSGATVFSAADGRELGKTPLRVPPSNLGDGKVELHLEGHKVKTVVLEEDTHVVLKRKADVTPRGEKAERSATPDTLAKEPPAKEPPAKEPPAKEPPAKEKSAATTKPKPRAVRTPRRRSTRRPRRRRPEPKPAAAVKPSAKEEMKNSSDLKDPFSS